jgi:hypothetical protein
VITEIEILGVKDLSGAEIKIRETAIEFCSVVALTNKIKHRAILIRREMKIPVPDSIISLQQLKEVLH